MQWPFSGWMMGAQRSENRDATGIGVEAATAACGRASVQAASLGRELGEVDLGMVGLAHRGLAWWAGHVGDGMRLLDDAAAAALAGEIRDPRPAAAAR